MTEDHIIYQPNGQDFDRDELVDADAEFVWLLSIEWAGRVYRWSSRPCVAEDGGGEVYVFDGGMDDLDVSQVLALLEDTPELPSVPFEDLHFPVNVAELVADGHDLASASGELAIWIEGQSWEERHVLVRGRVVQPEYGAEDEPVAFSLEEAPYDDRAVWPPATWRVDGETWPRSSSTLTRPEDSDGEVYPTVWGFPGRLMWRSATGTLHASATPAIVVEEDATGPEPLAGTLLVAGHHVREGATVRIFPKDESSDEFTIENTTDKLGQPVTCVDVSGASTAFRSARQFGCAWVGDDNLGAMPTEDQERTLTGLGEVIVWWLDRSTLRVDRAAWAAAKPYLSSFRTGGYSDKEVVPWDYVQEHLLPIAPLSIASGPDGLYPVIWRWDAGSDEAVAHLAAGPGTGIMRVTPVMYEGHPRDVVSEVRFDWGHDLLFDLFRRRTVLHSRPVVEATPDTTYRHRHGSTFAEVADARLEAATGQSNIEHVEATSSEVVWEPGTAEAHVAWRMIAKGLVHRVVSYEVGIEWSWLRLGAVVTLEDPEVALDEVALVKAKRWTDRGLRLDLQIVTNPVRSERSTGPNSTTTYDDPDNPPPGQE